MCLNVTCQLLCAVMCAVAGPSQPLLLLPPQLHGPAQKCTASHPSSHAQRFDLATMAADDQDFTAPFRLTVGAGGYRRAEGGWLHN